MKLNTLSKVIVIIIIMALFSVLPALSIGWEDPVVISSPSPSPEWVSDAELEIKRR